MAFEYKKKAFEGAALVTVGYGISQVIRLGGNLVLTRLLMPEMFGMMAIVQVFIMGLGLFSDIGVGPSLIQNSRRSDPHFYNTAWTIQSVRGVLLWLGSFIVAAPVAAFYENQQLQMLIPVVGSTAFIMGFQSTALYLLNRQLEIRKLIMLELTAQLIGITVMIVWAFLDRSIWSLIAGSIFSTLVKTFLSHFMLPGHVNKFLWDKAASKELFSFGKWIFVSTAAMYLAGQADRMILGKLLSFSLLGVYTIALTLAALPKQIIARLSQSIIFPLATHYSKKPRDEFKKVIIKKRWGVLFGFAFFISVVTCFGDWVVLFLYDDRYVGAASMLPLLALGTWPLVLSSTLDSCLLAIGKAHYKAVGNSTLFLYMLLALPAFYDIAGVAGAILAISLKEIPAYFWVAWGSKKEGIVSFRQEFLTSLFLIVLIVLFMSLRYALGEASPIFQLFSQGIPTG